MNFDKSEKKYSYLVDLSSITLSSREPHEIVKYKNE